MQGGHGNTRYKDEEISYELKEKFVCGVGEG